MSDKVRIRGKCVAMDYKRTNNDFGEATIEVEGLREKISDIIYENICKTDIWNDSLTDKIPQAIGSEEVKEECKHKWDLQVFTVSPGESVYTYKCRFCGEYKNTSKPIEECTCGATATDNCPIHADEVKEEKPKEECRQCSNPLEKGIHTCKPKEEPNNDIKTIISLLELIHRDIENILSNQRMS